MARVLAAFLTGLLFGLGLVVSQMISPAKVQGFLDLAGAWDPSLALVMAAALVVTAAGYPLVVRRTRPLLAAAFQVPTRRDKDPRLVGGAATFGIGWGLAGYCPGPALAAITIGDGKTLVFIGAMLAGIWAKRLTDPRAKPAVSQP